MEKLALDSRSVQNIIKSRQIINSTHDGQRVSAKIMNNPTPYMAQNSDKQDVAMKLIYNTNLLSGVAMRNPRNVEILKAALAAEKAGKSEEAEKAFNDYLNAITVSFSTWERSSLQFTKGEVIVGDVELVTTEKGQLLRLRDVAAKGITKLTAAKVGSLEDLLNFGGDDAQDGGETPATDEVKDLFTKQGPKA